MEILKKRNNKSKKKENNFKDRGEIKRKTVRPISKQLVNYNLRTAFLSFVLFIFSNKKYGRAVNLCILYDSITHNYITFCFYCYEEGASKLC